MNIISEMLKLGMKIAASSAEAQIELSKMALEDCNQFCKVDSGETRASSYKASNLLTGRLVWDTKYARHAYYLGEADLSKNPSASRLWAHKAAALNQKKWYIAAKSRFITSMIKRGSR